MIRACVYTGFDIGLEFDGQRRHWYQQCWHVRSHFMRFSHPCRRLWCLVCRQHSDARAVDHSAAAARQGVLTSSLCRIHCVYVKFLSYLTGDAAGVRMHFRSGLPDPCRRHSALSGSRARARDLVTNSNLKLNRDWT